MLIRGGPMRWQGVLDGLARYSPDSREGRVMREKFIAIFLTTALEAALEAGPETDEEGREWVTVRLERGLAEAACQMLGPLVFKEVKKRGRPQALDRRTEMLAVNLFSYLRFAEGVSYEEAIAEVAEWIGVSETTARTVVKDYSFYVSRLSENPRKNLDMLAPWLEARRKK